MMSDEDHMNEMDLPLGIGAGWREENRKQANELEAELGLSIGFNGAKRREQEASLKSRVSGKLKRRGRCAWGA